MYVDISVRCLHNFLTSMRTPSRALERVFTLLSAVNRSYLRW